MENIQLIKDILANKVTDYTIYDIFSEDELEYEDEIFIYTLDAICIEHEMLSDEDARWEQGIADDESITDDIRITHGLDYIEQEIRDYCMPETFAKDLYLYKTMDIDDKKIVVCYEAFGEVYGMGSYINYNAATLVGVFESYDKLKQYYKNDGYYVLDDECDKKCMEERGKYILKSWDKDSIETETPKEIEDRLAEEEIQLKKERVSTRFEVYTMPISVVEIEKTIPEKLRKFDSFVIINYTGQNSRFGHNNTVRFDRLKEDGMKMFFAKALGVDFKWSKKYTRCIVNISKKEAVDFINLSDSHFGVWYDGSVPIILYV